MISFQKRKLGLVRRYPIVGGRRLSNYWWSLIIFLGGFGFLFTGVASYYNKNFFSLTSEINNFVPLPNQFFTFFSKFTWIHKNIDTSVIKSTDLVKSLKRSYFFNNNQFQTTTSIGENFPFFPQGLVLSFYGFLGLCFSFHLWFTLFWKIGGGFNEFNGKNKSVRIFRWGRPGKNRRIDLKYTTASIETIKVEFVPRPALFLRIKGEKLIPLTRLGEIIPLEELEAQAAELTSLLQIPLEITS